MKNFLVTGLSLLFVLLSAFGLHASVYLVGPGNTYETIQSAIDAAVAAGGDNFIKIRSGTYDEAISVDSSMNSGSLVLSGGWDAFFISQSTDPESTVVNPSATTTWAGSAASFSHSAGSVRLEYLSITGGHGGGYGGGVYAGLGGDASLRLEHCIIRDNTDSGGKGGGAFIQLLANASLNMWDCSIRQNTESADLYDLEGGGLVIELFDAASLMMSRCAVVDNHLESTVTPHGVKGGGLMLLVRENSVATIEDSRFASNTMGSLSGDKNGSQAFIIVAEDSGAPHFEARRNRFVSSSTVSSSSELELYLNGTVDPEVSDSCISGGSGVGVLATVDTGSSLILNNLTVTGVTGRSVEVTTTGLPSLISLTNSIFWANGTDTPSLTTGALSSGNLTGVDPLFVAPAREDYSLQTGSPAIDIGDNSPAGGLSARDLDGLERLIGSAVDAGASEWGGLFADGFETEDMRYWDAVAP